LNWKFLFLHYFPPFFRENRVVYISIVFYCNYVKKTIFKEWFSIESSHTSFVLISNQIVKKSGLFWFFLSVIYKSFLSNQIVKKSRLFLLLFYIMYNFFFKRSLSFYRLIYKKFEQGVFLLKIENFFIKPRGDFFQVERNPL